MKNIGNRRDQSDGKRKVMPHRFVPGNFGHGADARRLQGGAVLETGN